MNIDLRQGDCLEVLKTIPDNSVDSVVVDPPYHLTSIVKRFGKEGSAPAQFGTDGAYSRASKGFMGKEWDGGDIAFRTDVWSECLRVLKPGGHLLSFSHSRTYHRMAVAIEDAGFEIRDSIMWIYGSGFPKSHNIGKAIDKIQGNEREVVGKNVSIQFKEKGIQQKKEYGESDGMFGVYGHNIDITKGNSDYEGWGTALKPAHEPICMARKPLSEKSIAENVLKWGTGGINIDGCRIEFENTPNAATNPKFRKENNYKMPEPGQESKGAVSFTSSKNEYDTTGRFPANIILDEEAGKLLDEQSGTSKTRADKNYKHSKTNSDSEIFNGRGTYTPREDEGGASRFFYCPKTSKKERNMGMDVQVGVFHQRPRREDGTIIYKETHPDEWKEAMDKLPRKDKTSKAAAEEKLQGQKGNVHPTVKPLKLMEYLITLVTPKGGVVMDCFMGSGSTGIAAKNLGFSFIGIEKEQEYFDIAQQRIGQSIQTKLDI
jgi:site-specific DNA-methyltransferase (adenine-specific)